MPLADEAFMDLMGRLVAGFTSEVAIPARKYWSTLAPERRHMYHVTAYIAISVSVPWFVRYSGQRWRLRIIHR